jgi:hypothetical protein
MKLILEILISAILHPIAVIMMWINLAGRTDLNAPQKAIWGSSASCGGSGRSSTSSSAAARFGENEEARVVRGPSCV